MARYLMSGAAAIAAIGFCLATALGDAGPSRFFRPAPQPVRRPATPPKPSTQAPAVPKPSAPAPTVPTTAKPTVPTPKVTTPTPPPGKPIPTPPQPRRDDTVDAETAPKAAIPHPTVASEVKAPAATGTIKPAPVPTVAPTTNKTPTVDVRPDADGKYAFRYHFSNGETVRWRVEHRAQTVTTVAVSSELGVQGSTQTAESASISRKAWRVVETYPNGDTRFVHLVEAIDMRQKVSGRQELTYNSETDKDVPPIFTEVSKQVGVPLSEITIDARGNVVKREDKIARPDGTAANTITLILPDRPLAVGESWSLPFDLVAVDKAGINKSIKARRQLTLEKVENGLALIRNEVQVLSPITDPAVEAQIIQYEQSGTVTFDLRRGRIVEQHADLDKDVFGFEGPESKLHFSTQFRETLTEQAAPTTAEAVEGNPLRK